MAIELHCSACGRKVTSPQWVQGSAYGSKCAQSVAGVRASRGTPRRARKVAHVEATVDTLQRDLFAEDLALANRVEMLLSSISLEMPHA